MFDLQFQNMDDNLDLGDLDSSWSTLDLDDDVVDLDGDLSANMFGSVKGLLDDNDDLQCGMNLLGDLLFLSLNKDLVTDSQFQVDLDNELVSLMVSLNVFDSVV